MLTKKIGIMQESLSKPSCNKLQSFPTYTWKKELQLLSLSTAYFTPFLSKLFGLEVSYADAN